MADCDRCFHTDECCELPDDIECDCVQKAVVTIYGGEPCNMCSGRLNLCVKHAKEEAYRILRAVEKHEIAETRRRLSND